MSPIEIIFVLLGIGILIASCFIGGSEENITDGFIQLPEEALELQKLELQKYADRIFEEKSENIVIKTDDYLSKISNEKIMSVNDFSNQLLEKINTNHKEVVFLYDMLNKKEDELKQTVQQFNQEKLEMQDAIEDVVKLTKQLKSTIQKSEKSAAADKPKKTETKKTTTRKTTAKSAAEKTVSAKSEPSVKTVENNEDGQMEFTELMQADRQKEEVLKLHRQGKNVLEISKTLGMGQGEVKLIIDLYGA